MKTIVYKQDNGVVAIVIPSSNMFDNSSRDRLQLAEQGLLSINSSIEDIYKFIIDKDIPKNIEYKLIDPQDLPNDRYFRNAWDYSLEIDMIKARDIHMDNLRVLRDEELKALDIPNMIAISKGDVVESARINAEKQALRDLPDNIDLSVFSTPEELKAYIPKELA